MSKKRTPQQEALRKAQAEPECRWFISWRNFFGPGFWTNFNELGVGFGEPAKRFNGFEVPEHAWSFNMRLWPFRIIVFKHRTRLLWIGDREWKKGFGA